MKKNIEIQKQIEAKKVIDSNEEITKLEEKLSTLIRVVIPNVDWNDVIGLDEAKCKLRAAVVFPFKYANYDFDPWKGVLLYGAPGTGKTFIVQALANEAKLKKVYEVRSSDLLSSMQGESEKNVVALFDLARKNTPCIIFIDEVDSLCSERRNTENDAARRIKNELLVQMDGFQTKNDQILVIGATNIPWALDTAFLRRFEMHIHTPMPTKGDRKKLLETWIDKNWENKLKPNLSNENYKQLAKKMKHFSNSDIKTFLKHIKLLPLYRLDEIKKVKKICPESYIECHFKDVNGEKPTLEKAPVEVFEISMEDILQVFEHFHPSVSLKDIEKLNKFAKSGF